MSAWSDLGSTTRGVWTRSQALAAGSRSRLQVELHEGHWQTLWPGVYADAGYQLEPEQRAFAAVLASGGGRATPGPRGVGVSGVRAVACGRTAARVHGLPLIDDDDPATGCQEHLLDHVAVSVHATALRCGQPDGSVRLLRRHQLHLTPSEVVRLPSGLYVTTGLRTLIDCAGLLSREALVCALDNALHRHLVTRAELAAAVTAQRWCPGAQRWRWAVVRADGRAESAGETLARLLLLPALPGLVPQHQLRDASGRIVARFDLGNEDLRLAVEVDGKAGHEGERMAAKDQRRDRTTDRLGWRTERCTWWETRCRQREFVQRVLLAADEQASRHGVPRVTA